MDNAREGITISDPTQPDNPLIFVNKGFLKMTGYSYEEVIGKNCRYLQGADTNTVEVTKIREAINKKQPVQTELLNYRKNGEPFWNYLSITPVFDEEGNLTNFIGVQDDITLKKEKELLEQTITQQKIITATTIEAQEKQREEIGKELHDNINQMLATLKLYLSLGYEDETLRLDMVDRSKSLIDKVIEEIRKLSKSLVIPHFEEVTLTEYITELVETIQLSAPFNIYLSLNNFKEEALDNKRKLMIYRILQEQLNNIIKYSKADDVLINFFEKNNLIHLSIKDNGLGFDASKTAKGIGLRNINSRLELENGRMQLITSPGNGCDMQVIIPL